MAHIATNFLNVEVEIFNRHLHILLNVHYPYIAFAFEVEYGKISFMDEPELSKQFSPFYDVLDTQELNIPVILSSKNSIIQNDNELNNYELEQIAYWEPERIWDIVFNDWN